MQTFNELLQDAVLYDVPELAHMIYYAVKTNKINLGDPVDDDFIDQFGEADRLIIRDMTKSDYLKMRIIKLYVIPLTGNTFAFYLTKDTNNLEKLHAQIFKQKPKKIIDAYRLIDRTLYFPDANTYKSFRDISKETVDFPKFVCTLESS